jgi:7,8-dihydropterin-6-yl-methyl-4-(beta-D-ribofuranosyl)aminobenzene 5'-phosphate synthase
MKLTVLLDNHTFIDRYFLGEPGVSYYIETGGKKILFDVGYSDAFIRNAQKMGLDLLQVDFIVLSHGHLDHTWGLFPLLQLYTEAALEGRPAKRPTLVAHPGVFASRKVENAPEIGALLDADHLSRFFELSLSAAPLPLTPRLHFLGQIERANAFEAQRPMGQLTAGYPSFAGNSSGDFILDDTALVFQSAQGLVIITGCSHAGVCNIIASAKKLTGEERLADVIGGFHLLNPPPEQLHGVIAYLNDAHPAALHPCHCTDLPTKIALAHSLPVKEVGVGLKLQFA